MAQFTIWNTLEYPISLETTHFGCTGIHNGVLTVCCSYDNLGVGQGVYFPTSNPDCCNSGDNYGIHVQLQAPGGDKRYSAINDANCPDSGNKDYHLLIDSDGNLHLEDGRGSASAKVDAIEASSSKGCKGCKDSVQVDGISIEKKNFSLNLNLSLSS